MLVVVRKRIDVDTTVYIAQKNGNVAVYSYHIQAIHRGLSQ
jgi:hypothetical protein